MKKLLTISVSLTLMLLSCTNHTGQTEAESNPFFAEFDTPFNVPPFDKIRDEHYMPAFQRAIKEQEEEIKAIVDTLEAPTFDNFIEALSTSVWICSKILLFQDLLITDSKGIKF